MNADRLLGMIIRIVMRQGLRRAARSGKKPVASTQANQTARQAMKLSRRIRRM